METKSQDRWSTPDPCWWSNGLTTVVVSSDFTQTVPNLKHEVTFCHQMDSILSYATGNTSRAVWVQSSRYNRLPIRSFRNNNSTPCLRTAWGPTTLNQPSLWPNIMGPGHSGAEGHVSQDPGVRGGAGLAIWCGTSLKTLRGCNVVQLWQQP